MIKFSCIRYTPRVAGERLRIDLVHIVLRLGDGSLHTHKKIEQPVMTDKIGEAPGPAVSRFAGYPNSRESLRAISI